ncbi:MAG TPA: GNAT family N-acetyltransferase [Acidimicrobiales bacterium]|nr:GNAT family N-acetyltransferase [Acidimicrobiales bacterium]
MEVKIRVARESDLRRVQAIEVAAGTPFREVGMCTVADDPPPTLEALADYQARGCCWVAVDGSDQPVAFMLVEEVDGAAHIEQVSVHPAWARRRIGERLIRTAEDWAAANGMAAVTLTTFSDVPWNRPYYERLGFQVLDEKELSPGLRRTRMEEAERGLDRWRRVAMQRRLGDKP